HISGDSSSQLLVGWISPFSLTVGVMAVLQCATIAAVYLAAEARAIHEDDFATSYRLTALVCQVQTLSRANDPLYKIGFRLFASNSQNHFWAYVLESLAAHLGIKGQVEMSKVCLDPRCQWSEAKNIWHNAAIRTVFYRLGTPLRRAKRRFSQPQA
ncbi:MAG: hypothetical protein ACRDHW_16065, partial [Ktedonobacteraceae bacterium]